MASCPQRPSLGPRSALLLPGAGTLGAQGCLMWHESVAATVRREVRALGGPTLPPLAPRPAGTAGPAPSAPPARGGTHLGAARSRRGLHPPGQLCQEPCGLAAPSSPRELGFLRPPAPLHSPWGPPDPPGRAVGRLKAGPLWPLLGHGLPPCPLARSAASSQPRCKHRSLEGVTPAGGAVRLSSPLPSAWRQRVRRLDGWPRRDPAAGEPGRGTGTVLTGLHGQLRAGAESQSSGLPGTVRQRLAQNSRGLYQPLQGKPRAGGTRQGTGPWAPPVLRPLPQRPPPEPGPTQHRRVLGESRARDNTA